jgi:hypothetical protein
MDDFKEADYTKVSSCRKEPPCAAALEPGPVLTKPDQEWAIDYVSQIDDEAGPCVHLHLDSHDHLPM